MRRRAFILFVTFYGLVACPGERADPEVALAEYQTERLEAFGSDAAFDDYVWAVRHARGGWGFPFGCGDASQGLEAPAEAAADESITNNQEAGVDEGGIVKAAGDYFVILRRGRLFTVRLNEEQWPSLVPISQVDAFPPGYTKGSWYDEMLVHGDRVIVIGYSYGLGATELGFFRLSADGQLSHEAHYFLRSNDYYSSRNYASRLVGDKLVFYVPYYNFIARGEVRTPALRRWVRGNDITDWQELMPKREVLRPLAPTLHPTLHTVVQCDLSAGELACSARAVSGPPGRTFYVSREAVYVWVAPWKSTSTGNSGPATLYRMPLVDGEISAVRAQGVPLDQFSFKEVEGGVNVALTASGFGDAMGGAEWARGTLRLLRIPKDAFGRDARALPAEAYTELPGTFEYSMQNRHVGEFLLYGRGIGWGNGQATDRRVYVVRSSAPDQVHALELSHGVDRIEALGSGAAVIGSDGTDLFFTSVALGETPAVRSVHQRPDSAQGETRSHGFFFRPDGSGGGVLGLPVRHDGAAWRHLRYGSAEVTFLRVDPELALSPLGALSASETAPVEDSCSVSCVDWYGNARPIFYRGRVFALLGYELVEGSLAADSMSELRRVTFLQ